MRRLLITLMLLSWVAPAYAEDQECFEGEYLLEVSRIAPLRAKAVQEATLASAGAMAVAEDHPRVVMLTKRGKRRIGGARIVVSDFRGGVCKQLLKRWRSLRRNKARPRVASCACNGVLRATLTPNDNLYSQQWGLHQASDIDMDAPEAWNISTGSRSIAIGVIDSGVSYNHPDLIGNMWVNTGEIANNGIDDDGNGYIDDVRGLNAITYNPSSRQAGNPDDDNGHGTHVAGSIGAISNNSIGVAGVAHQVTLVPIKFLSASGSGSLVDALESIDYATKLKLGGLNLVATNNSWGGGGYFQPLKDSIKAAKDAGILFVAAAGNNSTNSDSSPGYPAAYNEDNIISVAAIDRYGNLASFSNYGATTVDIGAPGVDIGSTYPGSTYKYLNGTSMASPHVAGAVALLKSYSFNLGWLEAKNVILSSGDPLGSLAGKTSTGKTLNIHRMLQSVPHNPAPPPGEILPTPTPTIVPTPSATATPQPTPTVAPGNWNISGQVALSGAALSNARVELISGGNTSVRMSDANGAFSFNSVAGPTSYTLTTSKSGYVFAPISGVLVENVNHQINAQSRSFTLTVQVLSPERAPRSGVMVNAGIHGSGQTDSQGRIQFQVPARVAYQITLASNNYQLVETQLSGELHGDTTRVAIAR